MPRGRMPMLFSDTNLSTPGSRHVIARRPHYAAARNVLDKLEQRARATVLKKVQKNKG